MKDNFFTSASGLAITGLLALTAAGFAPVAYAQEAQAKDDGGLVEVIVTAQKRETNLQKTPIAISVLRSDDLVNRHVQSLSDLADGAIPSLRVAPFFARSSALIVNTRGIGAMTDANQPNRDQGVGVYVDGVYMGRAQGLGTALFDIDRIEVARGPQGTLFGRNTEGGAVSIVTKKPSGTFKLNATVGVSNFGGQREELHMDLPAWHNLSAKLDVLNTSRDGTVKNPLEGAPDFNAYDKRGARLSVRWAPSEDLSVTYAYDTSRDATTPYYVQLLTKGSYPMSPLAALQPERAAVGNFGVPLQYSVGDTNGHLLTVDWSLNDNLKFKSITSYRELTQSQYDNGSTNLSAYVLSATPTSTFSRYSLANFAQNQLSQEFQLVGKTENLNYIGGVFYYQESVNDNAWTPNTLKWNGSPTSYSPLDQADWVASNPFPDRASHARAHSVGAYGQATWTPDFAGKITHFTIGGRASQDRKAGSLDLVNGVLPVVTVDGVTTSAVQTMDKTWSHFDPLVVASITPAANLDFYAKWSTGYKAGGANSRSLTYRTFDPESVSMSEIGAKTEFLNRRVRFNIAAFDGDYKDAQIDFNATFAVGGSNRATLETTNATGTGKTSGYEADLTAAITRYFTVTTSMAHTDTTLPQAPNPFAGNALTTVYAINTPRSTHSIAMDYNRPLGEMTLRAHFDANFASPYHATSGDATLADKSTVVNARLALSDIAIGSGQTKVQVSLWSRNLGNEQHVFYKGGGALGNYGIFNEPRTYGLDLNVKY